MSYYQCQKQFG
jgi:hypothetical protein